MFKKRCVFENLEKIVFKLICVNSLFGRVRMAEYSIGHIYDMRFCLEGRRYILTSHMRRENGEVGNL